MSMTKSFHHIVINTKYRHMTIDMIHCDDMYRFITTIIKQDGSLLYRIGGIENHIHMLVDVSPAVSLADLVRDIKRASSLWAKKSGLFPLFRGWGKEYGAFSVSHSHVDAVCNYIREQVSHHKGASFEQEYQRLVERNGGGWDEFLLS